MLGGNGESLVSGYSHMLKNKQTKQAKWQGMGPSVSEHLLSLKAAAGSGCPSLSDEWNLKFWGMISSFYFSLSEFL